MRLAEPLSKIVEALIHEDFDYFDLSLVSYCNEPNRVLLRVHEASTIMDNSEQVSPSDDTQECIKYPGIITYLPDHILSKVERASVAVDLDARVPLLNHRQVELALRVPVQFKYSCGQGKWLLRQVINRYEPTEMMERPKMGFAIPIDAWLRGLLRDWADSLIDERRLRHAGFVDVTPIRQMWQEHQSGKRRWHHYLWGVLMFQAWLDGIQN